MPFEPAKRISCKRCQYRKLKCSRTEPCQNCVTAKQTCEYREVDRKRRPATHEYVVSLENRVASLESFIRSLQTAPDKERDEMLRTVSFGDHLQAGGSRTVENRKTAQRTPEDEGRRSTAHLQVDVEGSLIYHGATSIYRANAYRPTTSNTLGAFSSQSSPNLVSESTFEHVAEHFGINLQDELVSDALLQFFKWQYPHFMFIYREAFLRDHFGERSNCKYWSSALLLSICALGTLMSPDKRHRQASEQFFSAAESILIVSGFTKPSIVTVQGFLCLAFYEIGRGNLSKGWGFSGIAFRMAQDLGFQRDPKHWISHDSSIVTEEDMEIRRRIFWGCYTSDKLISLILGRPVYLFYDDAEVETTERLPDFPEMAPWLPAGIAAYDGRFADISPLPLVPCFKEQIRLSKIIEKMLSKLFSTKSNLEGLRRQACLDSLNFELCSWYEALPECAKWNRWEPPSTPLIPSVAALHLLFHSVRIALNFDHAASGHSGAMIDNARKDCVSSAQNITHISRKYRSQYGLLHSPLIMIYAVMQAARTLTLFGTAEEAQYLVHSLDECCAAWDLAEQARNKLTQM
ncbi:putative transcriptional regulatory protein [Colletotrichum aenigma]|uniref:putative transcriptional regulatory protein n=1 Tax=Colletotrichum aenigma TaxID=1215731 RepID=UPI00187259CD|nr:putative transcriptional regulatory protein [Colletotrichum aenigma]KAF5527928.1 putative transcriptional regulatory protein [Colletotrichum aenigma]